MTCSVALAVAMLSVAQGAPMELPKSVLAFEAEHNMHSDQSSSEPLPTGLVFYQPEEIYLDGSMCAYASEGSSSNLPLGSDPYTLEMSIKPDARRHAWFAGLVGWGTYSCVTQPHAQRASAPSLVCCAPAGSRLTRRMGRITSLAAGPTGTRTASTA